MKWISATESLPKKYGVYLTARELSGMRNKTFVTAVLFFYPKSGRFNDSDGSGNYALPVDYWALIEPPEEGAVMR